MLAVKRQNWTLFSMVICCRMQDQETCTSRKLLLINMPCRLWDDCLEYKVYINSHMTNNIFMLKGEVLKTVLSGETTNISHFCKLGQYKWVKFCSTTISFPKDLQVIKNNIICIWSKCFQMKTVTFDIQLYVHTFLRIWFEMLSHIHNFYLHFFSMITMQCPSCYHDMTPNSLLSLHTWNMFCSRSTMQIQQCIKLLKRTYQKHQICHAKSLPTGTLTSTAYFDIIITKFIQQYKCHQMIWHRILYFHCTHGTCFAAGVQCKYNNASNY